jgi:hypothetical protein
MSERVTVKNDSGREGFYYPKPDPIHRTYACREVRPWYSPWPEISCSWETDPQTYTETRGLPDGDNVEIRVTDGRPDWLEFVLAIDDDITFWKGMGIGSSSVSPLVEGLPRMVEINGDGNVVPRAGPDPAPDDRQKSEPLSWPVEEAEISTLNFGKGKFLNIHTWMYTMKMSDLERLSGKRIEFFWKGD